MEYKHFSHTHSLIVHQVPAGSQITCSACKFPGTGSVYTCWPCSYFLHEQCFQATRSLNHPSHPIHPLTLVPYPTYPSSSFFCNTCNLIGSAMSYSCSHCEFDLHLHCALMPTAATVHESYPSSMTLNYPISNNPIQQINHAPIYPPPANAMQNFTAPVINHYPISQPLYPSYPSAADQALQNNHFPNEQINNHVSLHQPIYYELPPRINHPSADQALQNNHFPNEQINNHISLHQPIQYELPPRFNNPQTTEPSIIQVVEPPAPEVVQPQGNPVVGVQAVPPQGYPDVEEHTQLKKQIKHFSHNHPLRLSEVKEEESIVCSGCEDIIIGLSYSCVTSKCEFYLHKLCFELEQSIKHESHIEHPLDLVASPPYKESDDFTCNACLKVGSAFAYHCKTCQYDLHVNCASLPKTVKRGDHEHALVLFYTSTFKKKIEDQDDSAFGCDVCDKVVDERCWMYYCQKCDFGTHLECIGTAQQSQESGSSQDQEYLESLLEAQNQMKLLQLQMEMNGQVAQMIANMGQSMVNLT